MSSNKLNVRKILAMLATAVFTVGLTGCLGREEPITTTEPEPIVTDVPWEDYFNNNPISVQLILDLPMRKRLALYNFLTSLMIMYLA